MQSLVNDGLLALSVAINIIVLCFIVTIWWYRKAIIRHTVAPRTNRRMSQFNMFCNNTADIVFFGDSLTEGGEWQEIFPNLNIANRGIGGNTTDDLLARVDQVISLKPQKIFLMIGINDINQKIASNTIQNNFNALFDTFDTETPSTKIYLQSILPINDSWYFSGNDRVPGLNSFLMQQAKLRDYTYIDLYSAFADRSGHLKPDLSNDGVHLLEAGYKLWINEISSYVL
ncbi:lysophospholipase L1-like esterase [Alteromonadaceae bacterium 2753L.S.0a.02]|nr:lysophospholipase L1-like esterase [Alteromonadaceae bacterium 2753L.S.0a.02]